MTVHTSNGNITASKAMLVNICNAFYYEADSHEAKGYKLAAEAVRRTAREIYEALDKTGYFENLK